MSRFFSDPRRWLREHAPLASPRQYAREPRGRRDEEDEDDEDDRRPPRRREKPDEKPARREPARREPARREPAKREPVSEGSTVRKKKAEPKKEGSTVRSKKSLGEPEVPRVPPKPGSVRHQFLMVRRGLGFVATASLIMVMPGLNLLTPFVLFVGEILCLNVPAKSGARGTLLATMLFHGLFLLFVAAWVIVNGLGPDARAQNVLRLVGLAAGICHLASALLIVNFLRQVAVYISQPLLASSFFGAAGFLTGLGLAAMAMAYAATMTDSDMFRWVIFGCLEAVCMTATWVATQLYASVKTLQEKLEPRIYPES